MGSTSAPPGTGFNVLAAYRLGIILEGTHARPFAGKAPKEVGGRLHTTTVGLFRRALAAIDRGPVSDSRRGGIGSGPEAGRT